MAAILLHGSLNLSPTSNGFIFVFQENKFIIIEIKGGLKPGSNFHLLLLVNLIFPKMSNVIVAPVYLS